MSRRLIFLGLVTVLTLFVVGCNMNSGLPPCDPEDLIAPELSLPANYSNIGTVANTTPLPDSIFQWEDIGCKPEKFKVLFSAERDFGLGRLGYSDGEDHWPVAGQPAQMGLEPATEYFWHVNAWDSGVHGPLSDTKVFFTGPMCGSVADLSAPELLEPEAGEVIEGLIAELHYVPGGSSPCIPEGYFIDLQIDPTFGGETLLAEYNFPGTYVLTEELAECQTYYWRVAPIFDGEQGPFSETGVFSTSGGPLCLQSLSRMQIPVNLLESLACSPEDLTPPELVFPPNNSFVGTSVTESLLDEEFFQWQPLNCFPDEYRISISPDRDFGISRVGSVPGGEMAWPSTSGAPQTALEPATRYYWNMRAVADGIVGPESETWYFFTGPQCSDPSELGPPELLTPLDGATISDTSATLHYQPGSWACLPDGYLLDLQTQPDFSGTNLLGAFNWPGTYVITDPLSDCTTYHWRVAALQDGITGPFSDERSFNVNQGNLCLVTDILLPEFEATRDLPCYRGPNPGEFEVRGYILQGETSPIVAQNLAETWWVIQNPDGFDVCYVPGEGGIPRGAFEGVPHWNDPVTEPEPSDNTPLVCRYNLNEEQCGNAGGTWVDSRAAPPYCSCP